MKLLEEKGTTREQIASYRFDSTEYDDMTSQQMFSELKSRIVPGQKHFFLDEVQEISGWEKVINSIQSDDDDDDDDDVDLYLTGSNSRMMASEIVTYLTGRYVSFHIYTLSFAEYLTFKAQYSGKTPDSIAELPNFIRLGGFPATHLQPHMDDEIYAIVRDIYNSTLSSGIVKRN